MRRREQKFDVRRSVYRCRSANHRGTSAALSRIVVCVTVVSLTRSCAPVSTPILAPTAAASAALRSFTVSPTATTAWASDTFAISDRGVNEVGCRSAPVHIV
jgi:hypothetical protein